MLRIAPFRAIRPQPNLAARVASVPYDVVDTAEARELAEGNPLSFLHVVRPEIDLPDTMDPHDDRVYAAARENLDRLIDGGTLIQESTPCLYVYRQVMNHRPQVGLVCCCHIDDYLNNVIRKHEKTRQDKEDDRTRHVLSLNANAGPVMLTYRDRTDIDRLIDAAMNARPLYHFDAPDRVTHTVWSVDDPAPLVEAFRNIQCAYVADGHHRSASAARAGAERRRANPGHDGTEEYNWFLSVLFPARQLHILPYNRIIHDLGGRTPAAVLDALRAVGPLEPSDDPTPNEPGCVCVSLGAAHGGWHRLTLPAPTDPNDAVGALDVARLERHVLEPVFGIGDVRTDARIGFVGGIRGTAALDDHLRSGRAAAAISMYATSIDELLHVSDAGAIMPPKSTWFEPKLRSGLFVHALS